MKILKKLFIFLLVIVLLAGGVCVGGYFYIKGTYGIDLIQTVKELKKFNEYVDENTLCPHAFWDSDMIYAKDEVNNSAEDFITYTSENGYTVNFDNLPAEMKTVIRLTDKQVGALAKTIIQQELGSKFDLGGKDLEIMLKQVKFSSITADSVLVNTIVRVDITPYKNDMPDKFPFSYLSLHIPDGVYVSSTVKIQKGLTPFSYFVSHDTLTVNNLNKAETEDLFNTLDIVMGVGDIASWNEKIGSVVANALIGNEENNGLAYSLKSIGATDYEFSEDGENAYFSVLR